MHFKHGRSACPEYRAWQQLKARCLNPNHRAYPDYGGRGITVAPEWVHDFEAFFAHVGARPSLKHSLDRLDNNGGYVPGNLAWRSQLDQNNNQRPRVPWGTRERFPPTGVITNYKHGLIHTPEYKAWISMKDRCLNSKSRNYPGWGGRGITVHPAWIHDFQVFYAYVGPKPTSQHSLDRFPDMNGNYEPGNVRWATKLEQTKNRRPCKTGSTHANFDHGHTGSPEYKTWGSIKTRCFNANHDGYASYGGQGITMCQRWRDDFPSFFSDLGPKPTPAHSMGRKDLSGHYSCGVCTQCLEKKWAANCYWGTRTELNRNRRPSARAGKLTLEKAQIIRELHTGGIPIKDIMAQFDIGSSLVSKIVSGEIWSPTT